DAFNTTAPVVSARKEVAPEWRVPGYDRDLELHREPHIFRDRGDQFLWLPPVVQPDEGLGGNRLTDSEEGVELVEALLNPERHECRSLTRNDRTVSSRRRSPTRVRLSHRPRASLVVVLWRVWKERVRP